MSGKVSGKFKSGKAAGGEATRASQSCLENLCETFITHTQTTTAISYYILSLAVVVAKTRKKNGITVDTTSLFAG